MSSWWWAVWKKKSLQCDAPVMNATALQQPVTTTAATQPNEFDRKRIERALGNRKRYRYVSPSVHAVSGGYLIKSPCCSRNVDPDGGVIDVALLQYVHGSRPWRIYRKEHSTKEWRLQALYDRLTELLEHLNTDSERLYWQ
jgi:hypothetical protein